MSAARSPAATSGAPIGHVDCGGTIAMGTDAVGQRRAAGTDIAALLAAVAGEDVESSTVTTQDSAELSPTTWRNILEAVRGAAAVSSAVIVTHGTDTLAWTAAMLAVSGPWTVPVVLTAANIPAGEPDSDAETNLAAAVVAARELGAQVVVVFAGSRGADAEVFAGGYLTKRQQGGQAFTGRGPRLGTIDAGGRVRLECSGRDIPVHANRGQFSRRVRIITAAPFLDTSGVLAVGAGVDAVVLELYACGTASPRIIEGCRRLVATGVEVWACPPSPLDTTHYPSTVALTAAGVVVALDSTVELAAVALSDTPVRSAR